MSGHPTPHWCVQEKQGQHRRDDSSQIAARVHSSPSAMVASQERSGLPCVGIDGFEPERSRISLENIWGRAVSVSLWRTWKRGCWQLGGGWLTEKCSLFLAPSPRSYLKTWYWRLVWKREKKNNNNKKIGPWYPAKALPPDVMLRYHEGTLFVFLSL